MNFSFFLFHHNCICLHGQVRHWRIAREGLCAAQQRCGPGHIVTMTGLEAGSALKSWFVHGTADGERRLERALHEHARTPACFSPSPWWVFARLLALANA